MDNRAIYTEDFFESYLRDEVIPPEREAFEKALQEDADLKKDFESHEKLFRGLEYQLEQNLRNKIKDSMHMEVEETIHSAEAKTATIRSFNYKPFAIAASILLVASIWFLNTSSDENLGTQSLFALSEMESNLGSEMGFANDDKIIQDAFMADLNNLKKGENTNNLESLSELEKDKLSFKVATMKYLFYKNLSMENYDEARKYLEILGATNVDKEELDFLHCVLNYNDSSKQESECLVQYSTGSNKTFAKTAKSLLK